MSKKNLKKITPDSRNKLIGLVNKTAEFVVSGSTPTDALVKAAGTQQYSPEFILRAAEAYNGAAHLHHFKQAALDTRGDSFDLVDGHQVLRDLIDKDQIEKAASIESVDLFSDDIYYFSTPEMDVEETQKQASSVPHPAVDLKDLIVSARKLDEQEKLAESQIRESLLNDLHDFGNRVSVTKKAFEKLPSTERIKIGSELIYQYGVDATPAAVSLCSMDEADCIKISNIEGIKFRATSSKDIKEAFEIFDTFTSCQEGFKELANKQAEHYINMLERTRAIDSLLGIDNSPKVSAGKVDSVSENSDYGDINNLVSTKQSAVPAILGKSLIYHGVGDVLNESPTDGRGSLEGFQADGLQALLDPAFLQEAKEIEVATKMKQVLKDPVISSHPPRAIEEALHEIQALAPNAVIYTPLLRAMLRKRLESEGRLDDFEVNQLLSTDTALANRDVPSDIFPVSE